MACHNYTIQDMGFLQNSWSYHQGGWLMTHMSLTFTSQILEPVSTQMQEMDPKWIVHITMGPSVIYFHLTNGRYTEYIPSTKVRVSRPMYHWENFNELIYHIRTLVKSLFVPIVCRINPFQVQVQVSSLSIMALLIYCHILSLLTSFTGTVSETPMKNMGKLILWWSRSSKCDYNKAQ